MRTANRQIQANENKSSAERNSQNLRDRGRSRQSKDLKDNRRETGVQRTFQSMADNSAQLNQFNAVQQMADDSQQAKRLAQLKEMANGAASGTLGEFVQRKMEFSEETEYLDANRYPIPLQNYHQVQERAKTLDGTIAVQEGDPGSGAAVFRPWKVMLGGDITVQPLPNKAEQVSDETSAYNERLIGVLHETQHGIDHITEDSSGIDLYGASTANRIHSELRAFAVQTALTSAIIARNGGNESVVSSRDLVDFKAFNPSGFSKGGRMFDTVKSYLTYYGQKERNDSAYRAEDSDTEAFFRLHSGWVSEAIAIHRNLVMSATAAATHESMAEAIELKERWDDYVYIVMTQAFKILPDDSGPSFSHVVTAMLDLTQTAADHNQAQLITRFRPALEDIKALSVKSPDTYTLDSEVTARLDHMLGLSLPPDPWDDPRYIKQTAAGRGVTIEELTPEGQEAWSRLEAAKLRVKKRLYAILNK